MPEKVSVFKQKFTTIEGTSEVRRLPRLGKIRLGVKAKSSKTGNEYPKETNYFVCPDEVKQAYKKEFPNGEITSLDIMFPINNAEVVFPQAYKFYGSSKGLKCIGNGKIATRFNEDKSGMEEVECPCDLLEQKKCQRRAHLLVILPKVSLGGIYQIDVGSFNSIVDINSGIDYIRALSYEILGIARFALIPLVLKREPIETHHEGSKQIHYTLHLYCKLTIEDWNRIKGDFRIISPDEKIALPAPEDINPKFDEGATIVEADDIEEETEEIKEETEESVVENAVYYLNEIRKILLKNYPSDSEKDAKEKKRLIKEWFGTTNWKNIEKCDLDTIKKSFEGIKKELDKEKDLPF